MDWERRTVRICRQVARINGEVVEAPLKTKNSYRTISLGDRAIEVLKAQEKKSDDAYIFPSPNGGPISPGSVQYMLNRSSSARVTCAGNPLQKLFTHL